MITELARTFSKQDSAIRLARAAGFPKERLPVFRTSQSFWDQVVDEAENGVLKGGLSALVSKAAETYPNNEAFSPFALDESTPVKNAAETENGPLAPTSADRDPIRTDQSGDKPPSVFASKNRLLMAVAILAVLGLSISLVADSRMSIWGGDIEIEACQIRVKNAPGISKGWIILDSGETYEVEVLGATLRFTCPPAGSVVSVVVDVSDGTLRHWNLVELRPSEDEVVVDLKRSRAGAPDGFSMAGTAHSRAQAQRKGGAGTDLEDGPPGSTDTAATPILETSGTANNSTDESRPSAAANSVRRTNRRRKRVYHSVTWPSVLRDLYGETNAHPPYDAIFGFTADQCSASENSAFHKNTKQDIGRSLDRMMLRTLTLTLDNSGRKVLHLDAIYVTGSRLTCGVPPN